MDTVLSRRIAHVMATPVIRALNQSSKAAFLKSVANADGFDNLSAEYQQLLLTAEKQAKQLYRITPKRTIKIAVKGSSTSGNRGHAGRKGKIGGSAPKSNSAEPSEKDIKLPPNKTNGTQGEVSARARERVKIMEDTFPGIKFSDAVPNTLGLQEAKKRGEPGVSLPQAMYDRIAQHLPAVSDNDKVQAVVSEFKKWAVQPIPYVNTNALKFGTGLPYQEVFGVLNHLRSQDAHSVSVSVDRLGKPTHVRINQ